jgi:nickel-dependent lactate racemase
VVHDCQADDTHVEIGVLPSGARLVLNKAAIETDLLLAEGFIEPHLFSGFSGGRKSVLPGICSRITVMGNHCSKFVANPKSRTGSLEGNPMHEDMIAAARMAKLGFIVNVIINDEKQVVAAFAGHPEAAHYKGCETLLNYCRVKPSRKGDIVISSNGGAPLDQNVYQTVKGLASAKTAAKKGATLILCAECNDGSGSEDLYRDLRDCASPKALLDKILRVHMDDTLPDQWATQVMAQILSDCTVIFVSRPQARTMLEEMKFIYAPSLESALQMAWKQQGRDSHHIVIPDGVAVVVEEPLPDRM